MQVNEVVTANKKNLALLPKAEVVSVHVAGNSGKFGDGQYTASAFILMVKANGEWRPENEWLHAAGLKTARRVYTSLEKAKAAKEEIKATWGVLKEKKTKTSREEILAKKVAELEARIAELTK